MYIYRKLLTQAGVTKHEATYKPPVCLLLAQPAVSQCSIFLHNKKNRSKIILSIYDIL
jgi:hypothetical protein